MSYTLGAAVEFNLDDIWEYIAPDSIDAANRWIEKLFDAFDALAKTPTMGHRREELTSLPALFWPVGRYLIIDRIKGSSVEIVAVTLGSRDIPSFLGHRMT